jgi:hypothetical protein
VLASDGKLSITAFVHDHGPLARTHDHAKAALTHHDTPGKSMQNRLNTQVAARQVKEQA